MKHLHTLAFLSLLAHLAVAQSFVPNNLGAAVNSSYDEINPVLAPDGKTLFFARVNHPENTFGTNDSQDIWVSTRQADGTWATAVHMPVLNGGHYNTVLSVSADGNTLLVSGVFNDTGSEWKKRGLSLVTKTGDTWTSPGTLSVKPLEASTRGSKTTASMSADGKFIVYGSGSGYKSKKSDVYVSMLKENGKWSKPSKISALATSASEDAPFLVSDNKTLYFASNRGSEDNFNIYKAVRQSDDWKTWSTPVALNDTINTAAWESYFRTNANGSIAYYSSTHNSLGGADIVAVKVYEANPVVRAKGEIQNAVSKRALTGKQATILVNGQPAENASINTDSGTYTLTLPLNKKYTVAVQVPDYEPIQDVIDVTGVREFTPLAKNLSAQPRPYVLVKGKLYIKNTNDIIPAKANAKIMVDGEAVDSAIVDKADGTYTVKLKHGTLYYMQVSAKRFESFPEPLDLNTVDEYREINLDLLADAEKMAIVSGKVIDKKTNKPIHVPSGLRVNVEGVDASAAAVDSLNSTYELRVPLAQAYVISAAAPNYYPVYENIDITSERTEVVLARDLVLVPIAVGQSVRLNNVFFEEGKATLTEQSSAALDRVAAFMTTNVEIKIEVGGHNTNQKLSTARAKAVAEYLYKKGIAKNRVTSKGYGASKPVASNKTPEGKALNQRMEFVIKDK